MSRTSDTDADRDLEVDRIPDLMAVFFVGLRDNGQKVSFFTSLDASSCIR